MSYRIFQGYKTSYLLGIDVQLTTSFTWVADYAVWDTDYLVWE